MSSLSHSPYIETINYWKKARVVKNFKWRFLATKVIEMYSFKKNAFPLPETKEMEADYVEFAPSIENDISEVSKTAIVVPCFIRTESSLIQLRRLYETIMQQKTLPDYVIFVDDCSPHKYDDKDFPKAKIIWKKQNSGPALARNIGLQFALSQGVDIIAFTDSDCVLSLDWLTSIKATFIQNKNAQLISGNTLSYGKTWFDNYHSMNGTLNGRQFKGKDNLLYGPTANLAVTSQVGISLEFDTSFPNAAGEDIDFCLQANRKGFQTYFCPNMKIWHDYGYGHSFIQNLKKFRKQFERYAVGEKILLQKNPSYYIYFEQTEELSAIKFDKYLT